MSVEITFKQDGSHGLVAEGTYISQAAKRLGAGVSRECNGRGECHKCAIVVVSGGELLSAITETERKILGEAGLEQGQRLACQAKIERSGEVVVGAAPATRNEADAKSSRRFADLSVKEQVSALIEIEALAFSEAVNTIRGKTNGLIRKALNLANSRETKNKN